MLRVGERWVGEGWSGRLGKARAQVGTCKVILICLYFGTSARYTSALRQGVLRQSIQTTSTVPYTLAGSRGNPIELILRQLHPKEPVVAIVYLDAHTARDMVVQQALCMIVLVAQDPKHALLNSEYSEGYISKREGRG